MDCFCGRDIPVFGCGLWCDSCIDEYLADPDPGKSAGAFIARKEEENATRA